MRGLAAILLAGLILPASVAPAPALAQSSGQNTGLRALNDREDVLGWEAVGRLDTGRQGFCTATLIAPDQVLTAAHCVFRDGRLRDPAAMIFRAGLHNGTAIAEREVAAIAVPPAYRPIQHMDIANVPHDVALLRLAQPITSAEADPFILHEGGISSQTISVTSYGEGRSEALSRQQVCRIVGRQAPLMAFDCDVTFGSSGAPVFVHHGGRGRILSIISGGGAIDGAPVSLGMDLPQVVAGLKADLRRQGAAAPAPGARILGAGDGRTSSGAKFVRPGGS